MLSRRQFLAQSVAIAAAGALAGAAGALALTSNRRQQGSGSEPPASPIGSAAEPPAGSPGAAPPAGTPFPAAGEQPSQPVGGPPASPSATEEPIESPPPAGPGRSARENLRRGTTTWELPLRGKGNAEGYVSDVSATLGERLDIRISSSASKAVVTLYRLGWYGGPGARIVARWKNLEIAPQPPASTDPVTGEVRTEWSPAVSTNVTDGWVSGLYVAVISPAGGAPQYCTFVVRESQPVAPILFVSSTCTHQAYNGWGGKSLYPDSSTGATTVSGGTNAVIASWDRPYEEYRGAGLVLRWEYPFVRWVESRGYDVGYMADMDLERHPELLAGRRLIVFAGHPEYWSVGMRRGLEAALAAGTNIAMFSANEIYWRVRFDQRAGGQYRSVTCYRHAEIDPLAAADPAHATTKWRDPPTPQPESLLIGQMYGHIVQTPGEFVVTAPDHWIYEGTGLRAGDGLVNLVGQEYDRVFNDPSLMPQGLEVLATSPVRPNFGGDVSIYGLPSNEPQPPVHNATTYTAPSGATVYSAGTIQWSWALDDWGLPDFEGTRTPLDWRVGRITSNVLDRLGA